MKLLPILSFVFAIAFCFSCTNANKSKEESNQNKSGSVENTYAYTKITACQHASKIYWKGSKPTGEHSGIIKLKSGNYFVNNNELTGGEFILDMNSILNIDIESEEMNAKLVNHLKAADFFNVDSFPEGRFVITSVNKLKEGAFSHEINGDLTVKNISKAISFKANVKVADGIVTATSEEFSLNRTLWGINYKSKTIFNELKDKFIDDEFFVRIDAYSM